MVHVKYIPCLFDKASWIEFDSHNLNVASAFFSLVRKNPKIREDSSNVTIRVNGKVISVFMWKKAELNEGDRMTIVQELSGTSILGLLGISAGTITGISVGGGVVIGVSSTVMTALSIGLTIASIAMSIYSACTTPDTPRTGIGLKNSPTYGWDAIAMQIKPGVPVPVVYGEHRISGNHIAEAP